MQNFNFNLNTNSMRRAVGVLCVLAKKRERDILTLLLCVCIYMWGWWSLWGLVVKGTAHMCMSVCSDVYYAWTPVMYKGREYTYAHTYMDIDIYVFVDTFWAVVCRATLCETSVETNVINCIIEEHYILISHQAVNFIWPSLCVVGMHRAKSNGVCEMRSEEYSSEWGLYKMCGGIWFVVCAWVKGFVVCGCKGHIPGGA